MSKDRKPPITADGPLSRDLTDEFISDLNALLTEDSTPAGVYQKEVWLTKFVDLDPSKARARRFAAIEKWLAVERENEKTNRRIALLGSSSGPILPGVSIKAFLDRVRLTIAQVLPWAPSLDIAHGGFSGGASTSKSRRRSSPATKFLDKADATADALPIFYDLTRGTMWAEHISAGLEPRRVAGNVMFTVPKNSDIDRCAAKEPDLNMFLQKMLGNQIRTLLKRTGIDLNDQRINQELARVGSVDGSLATIDLSSASDSVCTRLVEEVLPSDWFYYMNRFRSPITDIDGVAHRNEMFSSMGNGFTFELESLLFYALARATAYFGGWKGRISVYGDDLIVPAGMYDDLVSVLAFMGFTVNPKKSFSEGPFRESCGAHWHYGADVKPFYLRGPFSRQSDLILTLNQLTAWASRCIGVVDPRYEAIIAKYRVYIDEQVWGGSDTSSRTSLVTGHSPRGEFVEAIENVSVLHKGGYLYWLFTVLQRTGEGDLVVTRAKPSGFSRIRRRRFRTHLDYGLDVPLFLGNYEEASRQEPAG